MPKRISVATHLSIEELEKRYRQAKDGIESRQYQIIWLVAQGKKTEEIEEITGYSRTWMYALVKRYNELGIEGLGDRRQLNQGTQPLVDDIQQAHLWQEQPIADVNWRFKWLWLYAFVHPKTGETYWWILPYVNTELFNQVLADFAQEFGLGANKRILLAVDQAGWHTSKSLQIPEGLHLTLLPSHSPELQPAERLWTLVDEPIANQSFETLDDLEDVLFHRCQSLLQQPDLIRGLTGFHWWLQTGA